MNDTIFALSSGALPSGIAVIRISGPDAFAVCRQIVDSLPEARQAGLRFVRNRNDLVIDQGLVLAFEAPHSFTGEDCVELQLHGGKAVVSAVLDVLSSFQGMRFAEAGEFSRRAFENGRLDLVEVEGLADLILAETEMQRRLAMQQMNGQLSTLYNGWAERLKYARAMIEAELDFADEDDIPGSVADSIWQDMVALADQIHDHVKRSRNGEIIRDGLKVAIVGRPNAGKSTLFNALVQSDAAIVTDIPGTTRDVLQRDITIDGFAISLLDTAGLRESEDMVEQIGVRKALDVLKSADVILSLSSADADPVAIESNIVAKIIQVWTKQDRFGTLDSCDVSISASDGFGLEELKVSIVKDMQDAVHGGAMLATRRHQIESLVHTHQLITRSAMTHSMPLDLRAELLRQASDQLGRITGRVDVEHLLDVIFSQFCIGK